MCCPRGLITGIYEDDEYLPLLPIPPPAAQLACEEDAMPYLIPLIIYLAVSLTWARIFRRIGWSRWLALLMIVPIANIVLYFAFVFMRWPIEDTLTPWPPDGPRT